MADENKNSGYSILLNGDESLTWDCTNDSTDYTINTRMIGKEDIYWDTDGRGEKGSFTDRNGDDWIITAINASHIPLPYDLRNKLNGATNVSDGIGNLYMQVSNVVQSASLNMAQDTLVILESSLSPDEKQDLINSQIKNLGGHTLTFRFPEGIDLFFTEPLDFSGFYNGELVIDLNDITITEAGMIDSLLHLADNMCSVRVINGTLNYPTSPYAIVAERCPQVGLEDLVFIGGSEENQTAAHFINSDGTVTDCTFSNTKDFDFDGDIADKIEDHIDSDDPHHGVLAPLISPAFTGRPTVESSPGIEEYNTALTTTQWVKDLVYSDSFFADSSFPEDTTTTFQGYLYIGGFCIQWGRVTSSEGSRKTIKFPKEYRDDCYGVWLQQEFDGGTSETGANIPTSISKESFVCFQKGGGSGYIVWFAIGR